MPSYTRPTTHHISTFESLQQQGVPALVRLKEAARISSTAVQTLYNQISQGRCRMKTVKLGARRYVRLQDLAEYIDNAGGGGEPTKRRTGRLTKREEIERRNGRC
jgi:hypothetical protein